MNKVDIESESVRAELRGWDFGKECARTQTTATLDSAETICADLLKGFNETLCAEIVKAFWGGFTDAVMVQD